MHECEKGLKAVAPAREETMTSTAAAPADGCKDAPNDVTVAAAAAEEAGEIPDVAEPRTPLSGESSADALEALEADSAASSTASGPTPRTHMVKERVKEERTYMNERGARS